jgi:SAM-dependent methyltransferase
VHEYPAARAARLRQYHPPVRERIEPSRTIPGATTDWSLTPSDFDLDHGVSANSELIWRLAAQAYGGDYPSEIQPWGYTTWWVLGRAICGLKVGPGQTLVDLGCGRGKPGLWLSRATGAGLVGIDWSPVAVRIATDLSAEFVPASRARFLIGDLAASGLENDVADAVVCFDAIFFAEDRIAALSEICRILRPGGRFVFTADEMIEAQQTSDVTDWTQLISAAGLEVESKDEIPRAAEQHSTLYQLWLANLDALRADIGQPAADSLRDEAMTVGPTLSNRRACLVVGRKPSA